MSEGDFLSRWSRRKIAAREEPAPQPAAAPPALPEARMPAVPDEPPPPLPPVESLTPESDFTPFMRPEVDGDVKRAALRKLFADPRFNVMDGLDTYIDDYSQPDPLPEGWLEKMNQVRHLGIFKEDPLPEEARAAEATNAEGSAPTPQQSLEAPQGPEPEGLPASQGDKDPTARS